MAKVRNSELRRDLPLQAAATLRPKYQLDDLLAGFKRDIAADKEWLDTPPIGKEL